MAAKGYVYIATDGSKKYFKIGKTKDLKRRQDEIRHMNPTFRILYWIKPLEVEEDATERFLHAKYAQKRVFGEWFDLSLDDISEIMHGDFSKERIASWIEGAK